jgi:hypothetical protein
VSVPAHPWAEQHSAPPTSTTIIAASRTAAACGDLAGSPGAWDQPAVRITTVNTETNPVQTCRRGTCSADCGAYCYLSSHR